MYRYVMIFRKSRFLSCQVRAHFANSPKNVSINAPNALVRKTASKAPLANARRFLLDEGDAPIPPDRRPVGVGYAASR